MRKIIHTAILLIICHSAFPQKNVTLRSVLDYPKNLSNLWGYVDQAGNEYALTGVYNGLSIVDVTNPDSIRELFLLPGPNSNWREVKAWNRHAYATNETGSGLLIADLSLLPDSVSYHYWTADTLLNTAHTLFIDEKGYLYLFGYNDVSRSLPSNQRGALICDLNPDPENPVIVGKYNLNYVHDGYARGDTLWLSELDAGQFAIADVTDRANPVVLAAQETPNRFTHNCWLSDDGDYLFTTDERAGAYVTSFDVSDIGNITELDRYQADPGSKLIPHNTYFLNNYLINSYYKYGVTIVDATRKDNLVEVGNYDTSPFPNGDGFNGCWGVYPYLPSGTIIASDIETGLYVLTPDYKRACYLEGNVTDDNSGSPLSNVSVEIIGTTSVKETDFLGNYRSGIADPGTYDVRFHKEGCVTKILTGVALQTALVETRNVAITCTTFVNSIDSDINGNDLVLAAQPSVFDDQTSIHYRLPANEPGTLQVFDYNGRMINSIAIRDEEGEVVFGGSIPNGIYLIRIQSASFSKVIRMVKQLSSF